MLIFVLILCALSFAYLMIGLGFALASWLQAAEIEVNETGSYTLDWSTALWFTLAWPVIAAYCYRTEVSKTIKPLDLSKFKKDK
ncbi:hypothetical protein [Vibrio phage vB_VpM-pA2SJ1]|uniref:Uncharacterized protein n=1 Tax=Vibrio phage vB_VpM-pA2SJ1 TaxID=3095964 RepID=A0AAX4J5U1_9CAUD